MGKVISSEDVLVLRTKAGSIYNPDAAVYDMADSWEKTGYRKYTIVVEKDFRKRKSHDTVEVYSYVLSSLCGIKLGLNERYIIYGNYVMLKTKAGKKVKLIFTHACTRTDEYDAEEEELLENKLCKSKRRKR